MYTNCDRIIMCFICNEINLLRKKYIFTTVLPDQEDGHSANEILILPTKNC